VAEGAGRGLRVRIEPHIESVTWRPELVVRMVEAVPGLTLTLGHSHFIFHALPYEQIATMHPYGTHWHARQARPGSAQSPGHEGQIDFARIVADLPPDTTLLVTAPGSVTRPPHLQLTLADGPGYQAGLLHASSTRQPGLVVLTDLTPTVLSWLGRTTPAGIVGAQLTSGSLWIRLA